jgi:hypothetical protein
MIHVALLVPVVRAAAVVAARHVSVEAARHAVADVAVRGVATVARVAPVKVHHHYAHMTRHFVLMPIFLLLLAAEAAN